MSSAENVFSLCAASPVASSFRTSVRLAARGVQRRLVPKPASHVFFIRMQMHVFVYVVPVRKYVLEVRHATFGNHFCKSLKSVDSRVRNARQTAHSWTRAASFLTNRAHGGCNLPRLQEMHAHLHAPGGALDGDDQRELHPLLRAVEVA